MIAVLLLLFSLAFSGVKVLSSEFNEAAFGIKVAGDGLCFVGRRSSEENGYDALLGFCRDRCRTYLLSSKSDDYSYTVETHGRLCLGGITSLARGNMDLVLVLFGEEGIEEVLSFGGEGNDMLWFIKQVSDGYVLVGGVQGSDWDILVVKLDKDLNLLWAKRLGTGYEEYAYGVAEYGRKYYVVGRSNYRGNWDAFILEISSEGKLLSSKLFGGGGKDYLRYIGLFRGKPLAVGRSETTPDSDVLILLPESGIYKLYDGGEFDYGRVFSADRDTVILMGDTYEGGTSDGLLIFLDGELNLREAFAVGGDDVDSVRYLDGHVFAGYTYSLSLDNDVLLGDVRHLCKSFVGEKKFREREANLRFFPYPIEERIYDIRPLDLSFGIRSLKLQENSPCQE
ncbi:hypothetical protein BCF55_0028 [Hydrogenivirga caldilitoris]|uniref:Delta-60 repeat protein n=1 Tax=Hydrogenivirga caldilitoris TaxID=246264 RepID=A0A497XS72_9AQUI|nr:hypothetical protein [Hydrogenivirga caldilitoris]RLJ69773.1 hypothetical protein BCF55_0028 [Hydrogenivirga caldilitoris]